MKRKTEGKKNTYLHFINRENKTKSNASSHPPFPFTFSRAHSQRKSRSGKKSDFQSNRVQISTPMTDQTQLSHLALSLSLSLARHQP
jgi:hypothetical protein